MPPQPVTVIALLLYVDDVRTSQEAYASTDCYVDSFTSYMEIVFVPHRKHMPQQHVTEDSFTSYM
jgi:hypothetical protein